MTINFIPNDPAAQDDMPLRKQAARPDRPASRAGIAFDAHNPQGQFDPGTLDFAFWQSREAVLAAIEAWEAFAGNLAAWADRSSDPSKIDLSVVYDGDPNMTGVNRLNAYYDGTGLRFFDFNNGEETIYSAISTDTVSHETGHALLDSQRMELFGSNLPEPAAFHEGFADCVAILTALSDQGTRKKLLSITPDLSKPNFVEAGSEYLSAAIRKQFGNVNPSQPRRALNQFQWQLPTTLPAGSFNDPPEMLSREAHNFSRVFSGAFYDVLRLIFTSGNANDEAALAAATVTTGRLLVEAVRNTPETARYFQAIGRAMVKADDQLNDGANRDAIGKAFANHGIMLGSAAMTAPTAALAGPPPTLTGTTATIASSTLSDIRTRIGAKKGARFVVRSLAGLGEGVFEAVHRREVSLDSVDRRLRGVVAYAAEPVLVGGSGGRAAVLGALPEPNRTDDEVAAFVEALLQHDGIALGATPRAALAASAQATDPNTNEVPTHVIRTVGGKKVLTRVRFLCGCCRA